MSSNLRKVSGSVKLISCAACSATIPTFAYESETDIDTLGLCSAGYCNAHKLVLFEVSMDEWKELNFKHPNDLPLRIDQELDNSDFRMVHILRVEKFDEPPAGISFAEFRRQYHSPKVIYSCPCCGGEGVVNSEMTVDQFRKIGGSILTLGNLVLH